MRKFSYLELLSQVDTLTVGSRFRKYLKGSITNSVLVVVEVNYPDGTSSKGFQWESGLHVRYSNQFNEFTFAQELEYEEVSFVYALKSIDDGSEAIYTNDCDGDMVEIDLDDDMGCDFDIDSFADLLKRTKFYIKK